ncbi:MAG TPA: hypothetical protein PKD49_06470 [Hyphomicrobium sp.]|nr:hypothetical protein [Hyphomicrobium sp.]
MVHYHKDFGAGRSSAAAQSATGPRDETGEARHSGVIGFLHRLFGAREEAVIGLLALLFTAAIGAIVLKDAYFSQFLDKTGAQRIFAKRWNERTLAFPIEGTDALGRRALFDVVVLTKDYGWVLGSTTELERADKRLTPADIENEVLAPQLREGLGSAHALIAVGLASQEGDIGRETQRGGLRAARIAEWVHAAVKPDIPMWTLNLGRYLEPCTECENDETSWQRPFIVIAMREADNGVNIEQALRSAMSDKTNLPSPERYSTFALARYSR